MELLGMKETAHVHRTTIHHSSVLVLPLLQLYHYLCMQVLAYSYHHNLQPMKL